MSYQPITGTGTGVAPVVNLTFPFIDKANIKATINGAPTTFTWTGPAQVTLPVVASGTAWTVYRDTGIDVPVVDFTDGAVLRAADLDLADTQLRYSLQEARSAGMGGDVTLRTQLASSTGAGLIQWLPSGTGAVVRSLSSKLKERINVKDYGAVGDGVHDDTSAINAALAYAGSIGGGDVLMDAGTYKITGTIDNKYPYVRLIGIGAAGPHDSGTPTGRTVVKGAFAGTSAKIRTPYAAEQGVAVAATYKYTGAAILGIVFDGGGVGTKALEVDSVALVEVDVHATGYVGTTVYEVKAGVTGTNLGEACDVQYSRLVFRARQIDTVAERSSHIVTLSGSSNANVSLNRGPNYGIVVSGQHYDGDVLRGISADNNDISVVGYRPGGAGRLVYAKGPTASIPTGFESNRLVFLSGQGATYAEGTGDVGVTGAIRNHIAALDTANSTPTPTAGTGSRWTTTTSTGLVIGGVGAQTTIADTVASATTQSTLATSESLRVYNSSASHMILTDGTNTWGINVDGGNGLRIIRVAGTGVIQLGANVGVAASGLVNAANDAGAAAGGVAVNQMYRNGSALMVRVA